MRAALSTLFLSLVLVPSAAAQSAAAQPSAAPAPVQDPEGQAQLKQFTGPDGHFSVMMPGTPSYESQDIPLQGGAKSQLNEWYVEAENHKVSYMLMYSDYPSNYANSAPAEMLIKFRDGVIKDKTLLTDQLISLGMVPGRAFTCKDKDGWLYDVHHFFINKRLYQLIVVTAPGYTAKFRDAFMYSFQIK